jgi:hypothetical protein
MNEAERYELVCKPEFRRAQEADQRLEAKVDQVIGLLKGTDDKPGICERIRAIEGVIVPDLTPRLERVEGFQKRTVWGLVIVAGAFLAQFGVWLWGRIMGP